MATEDQVNQLIQAIQDIAEKLSLGNQQEQQSRDVPEVERVTAEKAEESKGKTPSLGAQALTVAGAGAASVGLPTGKMGWILEGMKTLEQLGTGGKVSAQVEQFEKSRGAEKEMKEMSPYRATVQYADEMARAGVTLTREEIRSFHDRQRAIGERRYQNFQDAHREANTLMSWVAPDSGGAGGAIYRTVTNSQSQQMRNRKIYSLSEMDGE
jgi:hypothetical protein